jgi:hypothetical protein
VNGSAVINCPAFEFENLAATSFEDFGRSDSGGLALAPPLFIPLQVVDTVLGIVPDELPLGCFADGNTNPPLV